MTKRFIIPKHGKKFLGVAAATANYFKIDVTIVRIIWALLLIPGGLPGILPYIIIWLVAPREEEIV